MTQYRYEVRGYNFEKENGTDGTKIEVDFVCLTPPCPTSYAAGLYVMGKLKEYNIFVQSITRVIE